MSLFVSTSTSQIVTLVKIEGFPGVIGEERVLRLEDDSALGSLSSETLLLNTHDDYLTF